MIKKFKMKINPRKTNPQTRCLKCFKRTSYTLTTRYSPRYNATYRRRKCSCGNYTTYEIPMNRLKKLIKAQYLMKEIKSTL